MSVILGWAVPILQVLMNKNNSFILLSSRETLFKKKKKKERTKERKRYAFHEISQYGIYSQMKSEMKIKVLCPQVI